jgi:hypothetical protein
MSNVFEIPRPDMVDCMVAEYQWNRAILTVKLSRQNSPEVQYLKFGGVEVFSGPLHWTGANFVVRPTAECLELMQHVDRISEFVTEAQLEERGYKLYIVELRAAQVQVVCKMVNKYSG